MGEPGLRALIVAHDWMASPAGAPSTWPETLRVTLEVMLATRFPAFLVRGPQLALVYNDAYAEILADKHPAALGRPFFAVWPEVEAEVRPVIDAAMAGQAAFFTDLPVQLRRQGVLAPAYFTFSYSPVPERPGGDSAAVLCICHETTAAVEAKRQTDILLALDGRLRPLRDPQAVAEAALQMLGEQLATHSAGYGDFEAGAFMVAGGWSVGALAKPTIGAAHRLQDLDPGLAADLAQGQTVAIGDVAADARSRRGGAPISEAGALVTVPLVKDGVLTAALFVQHQQARAWTPAEVRLIEAVADRAWAAIERVRAETALAHREARFREFFEAAGDAIFVEDANGRYVEVNAAACRLLGYSRAELLSLSVRDVIAERDAPRVVRWRGAAERDQPALSAWRLRRKDGDWVDVEISARRLAGGGGEAVVRDVTERAAQDARRDLMLNELNHRVKNALATVQAIAAQTLRGDEFAGPRAVFVDRLVALARANDLLVTGDWRAAELGQIASQVAEPYGGAPRFDIEGPPMDLPPQAAMAMALALHELATNAAKYGALSAPAGRVRLSWRLEGDRFAFAWIEQGGPPVVGPGRPGFGSRLIRSGLSAAFGADVRMDFASSGLEVRFEAPQPSPQGS